MAKHVSKKAGAGIWPIQDSSNFQTANDIEAQGHPYRGKYYKINK